MLFTNQKIELTRIVVGHICLSLPTGYIQITCHVDFLFILQMSETAEKVLLSSLSSISNTSNNNGPSFNFHSNISTEELLTVRTPAMQKFLRENVAKFHTDGGYVLDAGCGSG